MLLLQQYSFYSLRCSYIYINESFDKNQWLAYFFSGLFLISIPLIGFLNTVTTYELIEDDKIIVKRWFKSRNILFAEIKNYEYQFKQLTVYDRNNIPVLFVGDNRLGMDNLIKVLERNGKFRK